jgi:hypothetical protein
MHTTYCSHVLPMCKHVRNPGGGWRLKHELAPSFTHRQNTSKQRALFPFQCNQTQFDQGSINLSICRSTNTLNFAFSSLSL